MWTWQFYMQFYKGSKSFKQQAYLLILGQKKNGLVSGNLLQQFFYHSPTRIFECVSEYIF